MKTAPFIIKNRYYEYATLSTEGKLNAHNYNIVFSLDQHIEIILDESTIINLSPKEYIELPASNHSSYRTTSNGLSVLLTTDSSNSNSTTINVRQLEQDSYCVTKPWGRELWLTGNNSKSSVVLKYIELKAGTKTSLQTHLKKFESNFIVKGKAIFRTSDVPFSNKDISYPLNEFLISEPTVIDVCPLTIHQVEAITDIVLIESSTDHLDDVIRLQDDTGRGDGKIKSEHQS